MTRRAPLPHGRHPKLRRWALLAAIATSACGPIDPMGFDPDAARATEAVVTDAAVGDGQPAGDGGAAGDGSAVTAHAPAEAATGGVEGLTDFATLPLVGRLPATTPAALVLAPPARWPDWIDTAAVIEAARGEPLRRFTRRWFGDDLTDPGNWARLWLDAEKPVSAALLQIDPPIVAVGGHLLDPTAVRTLIHTWFAGRHPLREMAVDDAVLIGRRDGFGPTFCWRGDEAWVVFGWGLVRGEAFHHALGLARPEVPLTGQPGVAESLADIDGPRAAVLLVNVPGVVEQGLATASDDPRIEALRKSEAFARRFDEFPRANRLMADRLRRQTMHLISPQRSLAEQVLRAAFYPFGPAAVGLRLEPEQVTIDARQRLVAGSLPATMLRAGATRRLAPAADREPALRFALGIHPPSVSALARGMAIAANRGEIAAFEAFVRAETGVDVRKIFADASRGEFELLIDVDPDRFTAPTTLLDVLGQVGVLARWGLSDGDAIDAALRKLERGFDWIQAAGEGRLLADLPPLPRIWAERVGDELLMSFDSALLSRAAAADQATEEAPPEVTQTMTVAIQPGQFTPILATLSPTADETAPGAAEPGSLAFERQRAEAIAEHVAEVTLDAVPDRDGLTLHLSIRPTAGGLDAAAAAIVRASMPPQQTTGQP